MKLQPVRILSGCLHRMVAVGLIALAPALSAGPILPDVWYEFSFTDLLIDARGCDPEDPAGPFCVPSSGTPTTFLDAPPWTFTALGGGTILTVTDAFLSGDQFEVFDFGLSLGATSPPGVAGLIDCGDDPVVCITTPGISFGSFPILAAGNHSITLQPILVSDTLSPGGSGFLRITQVLPEPGTLALAGLALLGLVTARRFRRT